MPTLQIPQSSLLTYVSSFLGLFSGSPIAGLSWTERVSSSVGLWNPHLHTPIQSFGARQPLRLPSRPWTSPCQFPDGWPTPTWHGMGKGREPAGVGDLFNSLRTRWPPIRDGKGPSYPFPNLKTLHRWFLQPRSNPRTSWQTPPGVLRRHPDRSEPAAPNWQDTDRLLPSQSPSS